jgi:hypothetical protein
LKRQKPLSPPNVAVVPARHAVESGFAHREQLRAVANSFADANSFAGAKDQGSGSSSYEN